MAHRRTRARCPGQAGRGSPVGRAAARPTTVYSSAGRAHSAPSTCWSRKASTVSYQSRAFCGFSTQWFSSGKYRNFDSHAVPLQVGPESERLADRHAVVALAVDHQHRRADRADTRATGSAPGSDAGRGTGRRTRTPTSCRRRWCRGSRAAPTGWRESRCSGTGPCALPPSWPCTRRTSRPSAACAGRVHVRTRHGRVDGREHVREGRLAPAAPSRAARTPGRSPSENAGSGSSTA